MWRLHLKSGVWRMKRHIEVSQAAPRGCQHRPTAPPPAALSAYSGSHRRVELVVPPPLNLKTLNNEQCARLLGHLW